VFCSLSNAVHRAARALKHLSSAGIYLPRYEKRDQDFGIIRKVVATAREIILMAAVAVACAVGVVLEEVDSATGYAFLRKSFLSIFY